MIGKHNFKIGDKVKLKTHIKFKCGGKVLTVTKEAGTFHSDYLHITYKELKRGDYFPLLPDEIEYIIKVGEQLEFAFMNN